MEEKEEKIKMGYKVRFNTRARGNPRTTTTITFKTKREAEIHARRLNFATSQDTKRIYGRKPANARIVKVRSKR